MLPIVSEKTCRTCGVMKPLTGFQKESKAKDGYKATCRSCRSVSKKPTTEKVGIKPELKVWMQEFERTCACAECGKTPVLPNVKTVAEARDALRASVPRCNDHQGVLTLKTKLRARTWPQNVSGTIAYIDFLHDITVVLKNFPHEAKRDGAKDWLAGRRDTLTEEMVDLLHERFERTLDLDTRAVLNEAFPMVSQRQQRKIAGIELSADAIDEKRAAVMGDENFNSIFDVYR